MASVSILMNGYNAEKYLEEAIDSIYAQTYNDWEIIFIDNCSIDNTKKIIDTYDEKIKYYKTNENIPLGAARNFGLRHCQGKYLCFLDTDDIWLPSKLEKQIEIMKNKNYYMCYTGVLYINELGKKLRTLIPQNKSGYIFPSLLTKNEINMQSVIIRNNGVTFREDLSFSPDYNLWLKTAASHDIFVLVETLVKYRVHANSLTNKSISRWGIEKELTLNEVFDIYPELKEKYKTEAKLAYAYAGQLKAKFFMSENRRVDAIKELYKYKFVKKSYFLFFILGLLPKNIWNYVDKKMKNS